jgi:PTH1 family peptidyl-tRNA hydrolase
MKMVVGLGNPGRKYDRTRHNVGFDVLGILARRWNAGAPRTKFQAEVCEGSFGPERVLLLAPQTFMNLSGASVRQAVDFYKLPVGDVLVVCDDFQLPLGQLRLRGQGSDGGQKGLADVIARLGDAVPRLRIGIGPVPSGWNPADFVLGKFGGEESKLLESSLERAADAAAAWVGQGLLPAMNQYNRKTEG